MNRNGKAFVEFQVAQLASSSERQDKTLSNVLGDLTRVAEFANNNFFVSRSLIRLLIEKGVITSDELQAECDAETARQKELTEKAGDDQCPTNTQD